jgi:hypothetical protein
VLSIGTPGSTFQVGMMYVCPDISVLRDGVRHGADHIQLANSPYTEEFRDRPPYDVWTWFNNTLVHGPGHPLLPRLDRLSGESLNRSDVIDPAPSIIKDVALSAEQKDTLTGFGVVDSKVVTSSTMIVKAVK